MSAVKCKWFTFKGNLNHLCAGCDPSPAEAERFTGSVALPHHQRAAPLLTHPGVGLSVNTFCSLVICCNYQVHFSLIDVIKYI